jgi:glutaredoxin
MGVPYGVSLFLISFQGVTNWGFRSALPAWIPLLCAAEAFTDAQRALLMSAFFPGYILTQIPGSFAIQRWGAKVIMSIDMLVTATLCFLIPLVTRRGGPRMLAPLLTIIGLSHGPLIPALQVLKRNWLKPGPGRALILRLMSVPPMIADLLSDTVYPAICVSVGWQWMPYLHGAMTAAMLAAWHLFVTDKPIAAAIEDKPAGGSAAGGSELEQEIFGAAPVVVFTQVGCPDCARLLELLDALPLTARATRRGAEEGSPQRDLLAAKTGAASLPQLFIGGEHVGGADAARAAVDKGTLGASLHRAGACRNAAHAQNAAATAVMAWPAPKEDEAKTVEWRIFTLPCVLSVMWAKFGTGVLSYALEQWAPIYFVENLGCTPLQVAGYLFWKTPLYTAVDFTFGAVEAAMVAKGVPLLTIRKLATAVASVLQSSFAILFGMTRSPVMAAIYYNLVVGVYGIHHAGFSSNLIEVGGEDTAIMNAIANNLANVPGFLSPIVGAWLRARPTVGGGPGSLMPLFVFSALFQLCAGLSFGMFASIVPAREILAARDARKAE